MDLSIIIPSLNEGYHLRTLTEKIRAILEPFSLNYEVWIIDDSTDDTPILIEKIIKDIPTVHWIHRSNIGGQNSAIIEGFRHCIGEHIIVMDGTLQHPPELFIDIYHALITDIDIVIPSRFMKHNFNNNLNILSKFIHWLTCRATKIQTSNTENTITDCTSNYFGLKRSVIDNIELNPARRKILAEILTKGNFKAVREIPYRKLPKNITTQKISLKEQWINLRQLKNLVLHKN